MKLFSFVYVLNGWLFADGVVEVKHLRKYVSADSSGSIHDQNMSLMEVFMNTKSDDVLGICSGNQIQHAQFFAELVLPSKSSPQPCSVMGGEQSALSEDSCWVKCRVGFCSKKKSAFFASSHADYADKKFGYPKFVGRIRTPTQPACQRHDGLRGKLINEKHAKKELPVCEVAWHKRGSIGVVKKDQKCPDEWVDVGLVSMLFSDGEDKCKSSGGEWAGENLGCKFKFCQSTVPSGVKCGPVLAYGAWHYLQEFNDAVETEKITLKKGWTKDTTEGITESWKTAMKNSASKGYTFAGKTTVSGPIKLADLEVELSAERTTNQEISSEEDQNLQKMVTTSFSESGSEERVIRPKQKGSYWQFVLKGKDNCDVAGVYTYTWVYTDGADPDNVPCCAPGWYKDGSTGYGSQPCRGGKKNCMCSEKKCNAFEKWEKCPEDTWPPGYCKDMKSQGHCKPKQIMHHWMTVTACATTCNACNEDKS